MRRRRMSRSKHNNDKYGTATVVLVLLLVAAFIYAFQSLGIYDILFKPAFNDSSFSPTAAGSASPIANVSATASGTALPQGQKIFEEIKMNAVTLYGVQLGVYTKIENAQTTSENFKKDGSAGYILKEDTLYRIVDSVFYTENDAKALRDVYRKGASPDACILKVQASGIYWKVNATREQIDSIKGAVSTIQNQIVALINTQKSAQQNQGTADDWKLAIGTASQKFKDASDMLMKSVGSTNSEIILKLNTCLTESAENLDKLSKTDSANTVPLVSGLKYSIIDILLKLQQNIMS